MSLRVRPARRRKLEGLLKPLEIPDRECKYCNYQDGASFSAYMDVAHKGCLRAGRTAEETSTEPARTRSELSLWVEFGRGGEVARLYSLKTGDSHGYHA